YLITEYGAERLQQCIALGQPASTNAVIGTAYGKPLAVLEGEWRARLGRAERTVKGTKELLRHLIAFVRPYWVLGVLLLISLIIGLTWYVAAPQIYRVLINDALLRSDEHLVLVLTAFLAASAVASFLG